MNHFENAKQATRNIVTLNNETINLVLTSLADALVQNTDFILTENQKDLDRMPSTDPKYDRLQLTSERIKDIADDVKNVVTLTNPLGNVIQDRTLPNNLNIKKVRVPLGVVGVIYEARPNVTVDVFALCFKTG
ncbi:MAG: gamma-glutamyl-phosphate reductase, partial [Chitinophagaceae bacterium]